MKFAHKNFLKTFILISILTVFTFGLFSHVLPNTFAQSTVQNSLEEEISGLRDRIKETEVQLDGIQAQRLSLEETLAQLRAQIATIQAEIATTEKRINQLKVEIAEKQIEIDRQKELLSEAFKNLYQRSNASALELILASDSFGEYLDSQEYLDRLKDGIADSVLKIQDLKVQLEAQQAEQEKLLSEQEGKKVALQGAQTEQQRLLDVTRGQEALFQQQLSELEEQHEAKEAELEAYLASLIKSAVSLGPVTKGSVIGKLGNTGWSSGPHLHMGVYQGSSVRIDPITAINNFGWTWPVGGGGGWLSQGFHSGHKAVDIAGSEGTPILAAASGQIIHRGCLYTGSNYATFGIIIDHGDYYTLYIHMQAPNNPKYSACSINRRVGGYYYGQSSIDYSTTN